MCERNDYFALLFRNYYWPLILSIFQIKRVRGQCHLRPSKWKNNHMNFALLCDKSWIKTQLQAINPVASESLHEKQLFRFQETFKGTLKKKQNKNNNSNRKTTTIKTIKKDSSTNEYVLQVGKVIRCLVLWNSAKEVIEGRLHFKILNWIPCSECMNYKTSVRFDA